MPPRRATKPFRPADHQMDPAAMAKDTAAYAYDMLISLKNLVAARRHADLARILDEAAGRAEKILKPKPGSKP